MRIASSMIAAGLSGAAVMAASPAAAGVVIPAVFDLTTGSKSNLHDGDALVFSAVSPTLGTYNLRVTAWTLESNPVGTFVREARLMVHSAGLGVLSGDDGDGSQNRNAVDNNGRKDFLLLQFDRQVRLTSATFNTMSVMGAVKDSDATIRRGVTTQPWDFSLPIRDQRLAKLNALFADSWSSLSSTTGNSTRNPNPLLMAGNLWLVGADFTNADHRTDGFRLSAISVIPEPASWALMIAGFGMAGAALRRRPLRRSLS